MLNDWWNVREMQNVYSNYFVNDPGWRAITCRYKCDEVSLNFSYFYLFIYLFGATGGKRAGLHQQHSQPCSLQFGALRRSHQHLCKLSRQRVCLF
jgi:hypothetical protein